MKHAWLVFLVACARVSSHTGVDIKATYTVALDQLLISASIDGEPAFAPGVLPERPRPLQPEGETATIYFPASLLGKNVVVRVDGLRAGQVVASGGVSMAVIADEITNVTVALGAPVVCGDGAVDALLEACDDGNHQDADGCSAECTVESGYSCAGAPSLCTPHCGGSAACGAGSHCVNDACVCDKSTCAGCCASPTTCVAFAQQSASQCGDSGKVCMACQNGKSCTSGKCQ